MEIMPVNAEVTEDDLVASQPRVRAMVLQRLELMWAACEPQIRDFESSKPDPRFIEAGIRITDRSQKLFRLDSPQSVMAGPATGGEEQLRDALRAQIGELESRLP